LDSKIQIVFLNVDKKNDLSRPISEIDDENHPILSKYVQLLPKWIIRLKNLSQYDNDLNLILIPILEEHQNENRKTLYK
jgi:hypothetical protein